MKKKPTDIDLKYERFLQSRKYQNLAELMAEYREVYGDPVEMAAWEAENAEQNAAHQARYEAEQAQ